MSDCVERQDVQDMIDDVGKMHPYKVPGVAETYSEYNDGWTDAVTMMDSRLLSIQGVPPAQPEEILTLIKKIRGWIDSKNRGNADYFIVDKVEEILNEYEGRYYQQTECD